jgi:Phosphoribosylaminoimidazole (AIR) synthetase
LLKLFDTIQVNGPRPISTGGGLPGNLPRVLPAGTRGIIEGNTWRWLDIFSWLQEQGGVTTEEMYRTFNCGVGMVLCVSPGEVEQALAVLHEQGETAWPLGVVEEAQGDTERVVIV